MASLLIFDQTAHLKGGPRDGAWHSGRSTREYVARGALPLTHHEVTGVGLTGVRDLRNGHLRLRSRQLRRLRLSVRFQLGLPLAGGRPPLGTLRLQPWTLEANSSW